MQGFGQTGGAFTLLVVYWCSECGHALSALVPPQLGSCTPSLARVLPQSESVNSGSGSDGGSRSSRSESGPSLSSLSGGLNSFRAAALVRGLCSLFVSVCAMNSLYTMARQGKFIHTDQPLHLFLHSLHLFLHSSILSALLYLQYRCTL